VHYVRAYVFGPFKLTQSRASIVVLQCLCCSIVLKLCSIQTCLKMDCPKMGGVGAGGGAIPVRPAHLHAKQKEIFSFIVIFSRFTAYKANWVFCRLPLDVCTM
jgi:hypothetical protein